jgi:type IV pilus assembly protein PilM
MPSDKTAWGIEIGQCALKAIRLRYDEQTDSVEALAFDYIEHPKILSQPDADPDQLSREALQTFLSRNSVKGERVVIGVPGQSGLARFIKLPPVEQSKINEIVRYEARQQIPFALEEVVWDFQTIGKAEETEGFALETEIGLFAMKRDLIYRFMNPYRECGVEVDVVQMRPLAVYNFAAFDRLQSRNGAAEAEGAGGESTPGEQKAGEDQDGFVVLLDIGADNSDLVITDGTRIWQRNLPLGGNHFTRALTKELKLTFAKAEHLKRNATKAQDPRAVFQAMRPVFNDLVSEIQRSVGYFASVHRQSKITKVLGMGNAFKLPGLQKFLGQNLQYGVEKVEGLNRLKGDAVLSAPAFQENILSFTVAYGLALQGLGQGAVRTSLLPREISQARMIRRKKPWALSAAALLMVGFTSLFFGSWAQLNAVSSPGFDPALAQAKTAKQAQSDQKGKFDGAKRDWQSVKTNGETLTANVDRRLDWLEAFAAINHALPKNPPDADRKKIEELRELQITEVGVRWADDLNAEWFSKVSDRTWANATLLGVDKATPPTGPGWVITLQGHHFHKDGQNYTLGAPFDSPLSHRGTVPDKTRPSSPQEYRGLHSAAVRWVGLSSAVLTWNYTDSKWGPWMQQSSSRVQQRVDAALSSSAQGAPSRQQSAGMGRMASMMGRDGGMSEPSPSQRVGGGPGLVTAEEQFGGRSTGAARPQAKTKSEDDDKAGAIATFPRTEFRIELVWQPTETAKRKPLKEIQEAIDKAPARLTMSSEQMRQAQAESVRELAESAAAKPATRPESAPAVTTTEPAQEPAAPSTPPAQAPANEPESGEPVPK